MKTEANESHRGVLADDTDIRQSIFKKVTFRVLPALVLCFFISYVDRANLSVLFSPISHDLKLSASSFGLAAGIFSIGYLLFAVPSNMALVRYGARLWLTLIMIGWGIVEIALASAHTAFTLDILRLLLGVVESGFYPGALFYLTLWYPRKMLGQAYLSLEYSVPISLALGSILTSALLAANGFAGLPGWRWVFIIEGLPAIVMGVTIFFILPDHPDRAGWLSAEERTYVTANAAANALPQQTAAKGQVQGLRRLWMIVSNPLPWLLAFLLFSITLAFWGVLYFLPKIIQGRFHVGVIQAGLITAIPWLAAAIAIFVASLTIAKTGDRKWHILIYLMTSAVGFVVAGFVHSPIFALLGLSLGAAGAQVAIPLFWTLPSSSFAGESAAIVIGFILTLSNLSGFVAPWLIGVSMDVTGNDRAGLYMMAGSCLIAALLGFLLSRSVDGKAHTEEHGKSPFDKPVTAPAISPVLDEF